MASNFWIKLYHEILHDPKMTEMSDSLWRRTIELFLLAGETDKDGLLPPIEEIAWFLRGHTEAIKYELGELARIGILTETPDGWKVTNFSTRQAWSYSSNFEAGYIYLMRRPQDGAFKIGLSRQPKVRLLQIQEKFPGTELLHIVATENMQLAESKLHNQYVEYRIDGEWFTLPQQAVEAFSQRG